MLLMTRSGERSDPPSGQWEYIVNRGTFGRQNMRMARGFCVQTIRITFLQPSKQSA